MVGELGGVERERGYFCCFLRCVEKELWIVGFYGEREFKIVDGYDGFLWGMGCCIVSCCRNDCVCYEGRRVVCWGFGFF